MYCFAFCNVDSVFILFLFIKNSPWIVYLDEFLFSGVCFGSLPELTATKEMHTCASRLISARLGLGFHRSIELVKNNLAHFQRVVVVVVVGGRLGTLNHPAGAGRLPSSASPTFLPAGASIRTKCSLVKVIGPWFTYCGNLFLMRTNERK